MKRLATTLILFLISFISGTIIIVSSIIVIASFITKNNCPIYLPALLLISTTVFIITRIKISKIHKELDKYSEVTKIITNIVQITGYGYFYSKKYKFKIDTDKIKALDSDNFEIATIPELWDQSKLCTDEMEISKSIEMMRSHNISVIHNILTFSLISGYINGEQRRILLKYGLAAMNNISDDSFKFDKIDEKTGHEIYTFNISTT